MSAELKIGRWLVNPSESTLSLDGRHKAIEPKAMELLVLLAEADGELLSRSELMDKLWDGRYVTDYALNNLVASLRKHLAEDSETGEFIKTRPKKGYQLCASVQRLTQQEGQSPRPWDRRKGDRRKNPTPFALYWMGAVSLVSMIALVTLVWQQNPPQDSINLAEPSIAVLPFDVFDETKDLDYFADGLAEEIIHQLTVIPELRVISRTSSFSFRGRPSNIIDIAQQLDVAYLLEGSVRQENNDFRITLQLINGIDGSHVWSKVFTAKNDQVFDVQEQISNDVARLIDADFVELKPSQILNRPENGKAYLHLLKGRGLNGDATAQAYQAALDEFNFAIELDPTYAMPYADASINYLLLFQHRQLPLEIASKKAQFNINQALELQPELAEAHVAQGLLHIYNQRPEQAKRWFNSALRIKPEMYVAQINYGFLYYSQQQKAKALPYYQKALEIHPLSAVANWGIGSIYIGTGEFDKAWRQYKRCVGLLPEYLPCAMGLAYVQRLTGQHFEANETMKRVLEKTTPQNYYARMAQGFHMLWENKFQQAEAFFEVLFDEYQYDLEALQTLTLAKLHNANLDSWSPVLQAGAKSHPDNYNLAFTAALAAYYQGNCRLAIMMYEQAEARFPNIQSDFDQMANGISNAANMAACYRQLGDIENSNKLVMRLTHNLSAYSKQELNVAGVNFIKAKLLLLQGKKLESASLIAELNKQDWPMIWLADHDPLFVNQAGLTIAN